MINEIGNPDAANTFSIREIPGETDGKDSFGQTLADAIDEVNRLQIEKDRAVADFATGKDTDVHKTMIALEKADLSMRLVVQVRNKVMGAFEEIMRMNI